MRRRILALVALTLFGLTPSFAQEQKSQDEMPGMGKSGQDSPPAAASSASPAAPAPASPEAPPAPVAPPEASPDVPKPEMKPEIKIDDADMRDMAGMNNDGTAHAMRSMQDRQMSMGPHMKMTSLRELKPGDQEKADQVVTAARKAAEKYTDYKAALADGYRIFLPNLPQKQYHFTNYRYAFEAAFNFNPEHPTSLLYEKHGDDYKLIGVMYTAPKNANWNELDQRIPLSIAQWHAHINMCLPPSDKRNEAWGPNAKFGLAGSITTKADCEAVGGKFMPQIFGWMVHVYPFEQKPEDIWSVERQAHDHME
ncbi:MAG TPA: hypothetical protein VHS34_01550 [Terriglobales bacterium]|jgi:hypothetical protein|nr:hypothetical protein [Terriglobales bacterium]